MKRKLKKSIKRSIRLVCVVNKQQAKEIKDSAKKMSTKDKKMTVSTYLLECHKQNQTLSF